MPKNDIDFFAKQKFNDDVTLFGFLMFLNDRGLLNEATEFTKGFIAFMNDISEEEKTKSLNKYRNMLEHALARYDNDDTRM